jgi:hypothetical protein
VIANKPIPAIILSHFHPLYLSSTGFNIRSSVWQFSPSYTYWWLKLITEKAFQTLFLQLAVQWEKRNTYYFSSMFPIRKNIKANKLFWGKTKGSYRELHSKQYRINIFVQGRGKSNTFFRRLSSIRVLERKGPFRIALHKIVAHCIVCMI